MLLLFGTFGNLRDLAHDRELAGAIGDMVIAWSCAEQTLVRVLQRMTDVPYAMASTCYYRIPTFEARTKTIRAMLCEWETTKYDAKAIHRAIAKLNLLARARNDWVHGSWAWQNGSGKTFIFDYRTERDDPARCKPIKAADVHNHVRAVHLRIDRLNELVPSGGNPGA